MPKKCEVAFCNEQGAHRFPKSKDVMKKWVKAIRRPNFKPETNSKVCRLHFLDSDYQKTSFYTGLENQHRYLKKNAVPSVFPWTSKTISKEGQVRGERLRSRNIKKSVFDGAHTAHGTEVGKFEYHDVPGIPSEELIVPEIIAESEDITTAKNKAIRSQTSAIARYFCTDLMLTSNASVLFYTGLESYTKCQMVFSTLLPMANSLKYRWSHVIGLSAVEEFCILLIKLRRNKPDFEVAKTFNVSKTAVSNITFTYDF